MADDLIVDGGTAPAAGVVTQTPEQIAAAAGADAGKTPEQIAADKAAADKAAADKAAADKAEADKKAAELAANGGVNEPVQTVAADGSVTFTPTGHVGMDLALEYFGKLGFKLEDAELDQAGKGNFSYLEAKLATMGDKAVGADKYVQLAKTAVAEIQSKQNAAIEERRKTVYDVVGGKETWEAIAAFAQANAEPDELKQIRASLSVGGTPARLMAQHLLSLYQASNPERKAQKVTEQPAATAAASTALTLTGYKKELNELVAKVGVTRLQDSPEYAALRQRYANVTK